MHPPFWNGQLDVIHHTMGSQTISCSGLWYLQISIDYYGEWCQIHNYNMVDGSHRAAVALNSPLMIIYIYIYIYIYFERSNGESTNTYLWIQEGAWCYCLHGHQGYTELMLAVKSLCFGPFKLKCNPRVFKLKRVCSILKRVENTGVV